MRSLDTAALFIDNLLDFSSDIGEEDDDDAEKQNNNNNNNPLCLTNSQQPPPNNPNSDTLHGASPVLVEEELEWLSNENAFPPIETFDILSMKPLSSNVKPEYDSVPKNQSPVSVLGNSCSSVRIPVQARSKRRRRRRSNFSNLSLQQQWWYNYEAKKKSVGTTKVSRVVGGRTCLHCGADSTPQWRAGPLGPKTLCNACGVRYKSGRLVPEYRPASSPTFSQELHSNSHRKIMDMRRQKQTESFSQSSDEGLDPVACSLIQYHEPKYA